MSFLGNLAAAEQAKAIGNYNNELYKQQAELAKAKANQNASIFDKVTLPRIKEQQNIQSSNLFVSLLKTGAEYRPGQTPYLVNLKSLNNMAFDVAMSVYNRNMDYTDQINSSLLLKAQGEGELFKGLLTARTQKIAAAGSLLGDISSGMSIYKSI